MTLARYDAEQLDLLTLRLLDLCSRTRDLACSSREEGFGPLSLNDRKALEWLDNFDEWLLRAEAERDGARMKARGQRAARKAQASRSK